MYRRLARAYPHDFRAVCGPREEERITQKDPARLEQLDLLRGWP